MLDGRSRQGVVCNFDVALEADQERVMLAGISDEPEHQRTCENNNAVSPSRYCDDASTASLPLDLSELCRHEMERHQVT